MNMFKRCFKALYLDMVNREFSAAPTVDPTVARVHLNKRNVRDLASVSKENKRCTSQPALITIVKLVHRRSFDDKV